MEVSQITHDKMSTIYQFPILTKIDAVWKQYDAKIGLVCHNVMNRFYIFLRWRMTEIQLNVSQWVISKVPTKNASSLCQLQLSAMIDYVVTTSQCCHNVAPLRYHLSSNVYVAICTLMSNPTGKKGSATFGHWHRDTAAPAALTSERKQQQVWDVNFAVSDRWDR